MPLKKIYKNIKKSLSDVIALEWHILIFVTFIMSSQLFAYLANPTETWMFATLSILVKTFVKVCLLIVPYIFCVLLIEKMRLKLIPFCIAGYFLGILYGGMNYIASGFYQYIYSYVGLFAGLMYYVHYVIRIHDLYIDRE